MSATGFLSQLLQLAIALLLAPVLVGWVNQCRAWLSNRSAPPLLQPYRTIRKLFTKDAVWEMPPFTGWYLGREDIGTLMRDHCPADGPGDQRFRMTSANGEPVLAVYMRGEDGVHRAFQLQQLTLTERGVAHVACYFDTSLFARFGLPEVV